MIDTQEVRRHEVKTDAPLPADATLAFIGHIETPWARCKDCPRQGNRDTGPDCTIAAPDPWAAALTGI